VPTPTIRPDVEDIESTKSEKLLALVLAIFLLIGGIWAYDKIEEAVNGRIDASYAPTPAERAALTTLRLAQARLSRATAEQARARQDLELSREAYRTALDAGRSAPGLERAYLRADERYDEARAERRAAERAVAAAQPAAAAAGERVQDRLEANERDRDVWTFLLRLAFVAAFLAASVWLLNALRRRRSRAFPLAIAGVAVAALLSLVFAVDYVTDYVDPLELGPLVLSLFGIAVTLVAFAALQRYLARRLPLRRARKRQCPYCAYPVRDTERCEGCGRQVVGACSTCGAPRRVGTLHCGACGAT
jgi:hypothetical protein